MTHSASFTYVASKHEHCRRSNSHRNHQKESQAAYAPCGRASKEGSSDCIRPIWGRSSWSNGIGTERSLQIYHSYVYPVFMYGLESIVLDKRSIDTLATFHMFIIKELQGLPIRCSNAPAYFIESQLPLPTLLDLAILTLLCNIAISKNNSLEILLKRQCALRVRKSWAMNAQDTLDII